MLAFSVREVLLNWPVPVFLVRGPLGVPEGPLGQDASLLLAAGIVGRDQDGCSSVVPQL